MLNRIKEIIRQLDFFQHSQLLRYQTQPGYRTLTGGTISIILIIVFTGLFTNLIIDTVTNTIISDQKNIIYDTDPTYFQLKTTSDQNFMFALGITNLDLNTQRYFDVVLQNFTVVKNSSGTFRSSSTVPLNRCNISQWKINNDISQSFTTLNLSQWLCPPTDYVFELEGKFTSPIFRYSRILIQKCGTISNISTCANSTQVSSFINSNQGVTANFYYVNPVINAGDTNYISYYLEDTNYFSFNTVTGVNANLFFSEYSILTDHSILPWENNSEDEGALTSSPANSQTYTVTTNNQYAKIYLRKSSQHFDFTRKFAKLDETLAFIGGLLGFILLILTIVNVYSKFSYEIEFGDRIFKQNSNGSFGSQHFNFIVFLGYGIYNVLTMIGIHLKWYTMRKYHECRTECVKQLDLNLLFKKIEFFQEVGNIVLQDHHLKGLFMLPKKKISEIKLSRKRFILQTLIYYQLDKKARQILVEEKEYKKRYEQFFKQKVDHQEQGDRDMINKLKSQCLRSLKRIQDESFQGDKYSKKIFQKMGMKKIIAVIFEQLKKRQKNDENLPSIANIQDEENLDNVHPHEKLQTQIQNN